MEQNMPSGKRQSPPHTNCQDAREGRGTAIAASCGRPRATAPHGRHACVCARARAYIVFT